MNSKNLSLAFMWIFFIFTIILIFNYGADLLLVKISLWIGLIITIFLNIGNPSDSFQIDFVEKELLR